MMTNKNNEVLKVLQALDNSNDFQEFYETIDFKSVNELIIKRIEHHYHNLKHIETPYSVVTKSEVGSDRYGLRYDYLRNKLYKNSSLDEFSIHFKSLIVILGLAMKSDIKYMSYSYNSPTTKKNLSEYAKKRKQIHKEISESIKKSFDSSFVDCFDQNSCELEFIELKYFDAKADDNGTNNLQNGSHLKESLVLELCNTNINQYGISSDQS